MTSATNPGEQWPTLNEHGYEVHPAFGQIQANRVSSSKGKSLFDSEIRHNHYVVLRISPAERKRDLNRDWIHAGTMPYIEVSMSEAQWASMVSSMNSQGTNCTIDFVKTEGRIEQGDQPDIPFAPRLALSVDETRGAADQAFEKALEALAAYKASKAAANLRALEAALNNAAPNVEFAAKSLVEHSENVVTKARADIEAMVDTRARQLGIDPHALLLETGDIGSRAAIESNPNRTSEQTSDHTEGTDQ